MPGRSLESQVRRQWCYAVGRGAPLERLPTLLRRLARDIDDWPQRLILGLTIDVRQEASVRGPRERERIKGFDADAGIYFVIEEEIPSALTGSQWAAPVANEPQSEAGRRLVARAGRHRRQGDRMKRRRNQVTTREDLPDWLKQNSHHFSRSAPIDKLPTLLRRIARDLDELPPHLILAITIELEYELDEATAAVFLSFDDERE